MEPGDFCLPLDVFWAILPFMNVKDIFLGVSLVQKQYYQFTCNDSFIKLIARIFFTNKKASEFKTAFITIFKDDVDAFKSFVRSGLFKNKKSRFDHGNFRGVKVFSEEINEILEKRFETPKYPTQVFKSSGGRDIAKIVTKKSRKFKGYTFSLLDEDKKEEYRTNTRNRWFRHSRNINEGVTYDYKERIDCPWYIPPVAELCTYHQSILSSRSKYYQGRLDGEMTQNNEEGTESLKAWFSNGLLHGECEFRSKEDKVVMICQYDNNNGKRNGKMEMFRDIEYQRSSRRDVVGESKKPSIIFIYRNGVFRKMISFLEVQGEKSRPKFVTVKEKSSEEKEEEGEVDISTLLTEEEYRLFHQMDSLFSEFEEIVANNINN